MKSVAIVGSGPAGLMAADVVSASGRARVTVFERRKGLGRKLLIAGSSGLNITNSLPLDEFRRHYTGPVEFWRRILDGFTPKDWIAFIEALGTPTFEGTSGRYFIEDMKASKFLKAWQQRLEGLGVEFRAATEVLEAPVPGFDASLFCVGGGSYEEEPLRWPELFKRHGIGFTEFAPSNVGYHVDWKPAFLKEAEGLPLKGIVLTTSKGSRRGECVVTRYGLEGTPVYFTGRTGRATLDLKPDLDARAVAAKLAAVKENLSPIRRVKKQLNLGPAAFALLFHHAPRAALEDLGAMVKAIKGLELAFGEPRPLTEAISSSGGVHLGELDGNLMLRKLPGVFCAGEMLDWDAPTGGFLIQGCVAQGRAAGEGVLRYL